MKEFQSTLLPALQRALLRSPEVITECVGLVLGGLNIDISVCAFEIGKSLIGTDIQCFIFLLNYFISIVLLLR